MVSGLINANPTVYEKKERRARSAPGNVDEFALEPIDQQEIFDHIRDIKDPEHPYSLEELKVITEDAIEVDDEQSHGHIYSNGRALQHGHGNWLMLAGQTHALFATSVQSGH